MQITCKLTGNRGAELFFFPRDHLILIYVHFSYFPSLFFLHQFALVNSLIPPAVISSTSFLILRSKRKNNKAK